MFRVRKCQNTFIYLLDNINTLFVDECKNCSIITGPVQTSLFVRNCTNCKILASCQQYRVRDCNSVTTFLACTSDPIIESSSELKFAPYQFSYPELKGQFAAAGLNVFNCMWSSVHDFSPNGDGSLNFSYLPHSEKVSDFFLLPQEAVEQHCVPTGDSDPDASSTAAVAVQDLVNLKISFDETCSIVPKTAGSLELAPIEDPMSVLVAVFHHPEVEDNAMALIRQIVKTGKAFLVRTRSAILRPEDIRQIFGDVTHASHAKLGPVIFLLFCGAEGEVCQLCTDSVREVVRAKAIQPQTLLHVTDNPVAAKRQFQMFVCLCDAQQYHT
uniref:Protein XRP2 n=2 Tax=Schistocephalus solidus TaxID=70667 RepID=A0A0X3Q169_SCHSO